jgi:hypothetical protein
MKAANTRWPNAAVTFAALVLLSSQGVAQAADLLDDLLGGRATPVSVSEVLNPLREAGSIRLQLLPGNITYENGGPASEQIEKDACVFSTEAPAAISALLGELSTRTTRAYEGQVGPVSTAIALQFYKDDRFLGKLDFAELRALGKPIANPGEIAGEFAVPGKSPRTANRGRFFATENILRSLFDWTRRKDVKLIRNPDAQGKDTYCRPAFLGTASNGE